MKKYDQSNDKHKLQVYDFRVEHIITISFGILPCGKPLHISLHLPITPIKQLV